MDAIEWDLNLNVESESWESTNTGGSVSPLYFDSTAPTDEQSSTERSNITKARSSTGGSKANGKRKRLLIGGMPSLSQADYVKKRRRSVADSATAENATHGPLVPRRFLRIGKSMYFRQEEDDVEHQSSESEVEIDVYGFGDDENEESESKHTREGPLDDYKTKWLPSRERFYRDVDDTSLSESIRKRLRKLRIPINTKAIDVISTRTIKKFIGRPETADLKHIDHYEDLINRDTTDMFRAYKTPNLNSYAVVAEEQIEEGVPLGIYGGELQEASPYTKPIESFLQVPIAALSEIDPSLDLTIDANGAKFSEFKYVNDYFFNHLNIDRRKQMANVLGEAFWFERYHKPYVVFRSIAPIMEKDQFYLDYGKQSWRDFVIPRIKEQGAVCLQHHLWCFFLEEELERHNVDITPLPVIQERLLYSNLRIEENEDSDSDEHYTVHTIDKDSTLHPFFFDRNGDLLELEFMSAVLPAVKMALLIPSNLYKEANAEPPADLDLEPNDENKLEYCDIRTVADVQGWEYSDSLMNELRASTMKQLNSPQSTKSRVSAFGARHPRAIAELLSNPTASDALLQVNMIHSTGYFYRRVTPPHLPVYGVFSKRRLANDTPVCFFNGVYRDTVDYYSKHYDIDKSNVAHLGSKKARALKAMSRVVIDGTRYANVSRLFMPSPELFSESDEEDSDEDQSDESQSSSSSAESEADLNGQRPRGRKNVTRKSRSKQNDDTENSNSSTSDSSSSNDSEYEDNASNEDRAPKRRAKSATPRTRSQARSQTQSSPSTSRSAQATKPRRRTSKQKTAANEKPPTPAAKPDSDVNIETRVVFQRGSTVNRKADRPTQDSKHDLLLPFVIFKTNQRVPKRKPLYANFSQRHNNAVLRQLLLQQASYMIYIRHRIKHCLRLMKKHNLAPLRKPELPMTSIVLPPLSYDNFEAVMQFNTRNE